MESRTLSLAIGATIHGACYFLAVVAFGLWIHAEMLSIAAIFGLGVTYLSFLAQLQFPRATWLALCLVGLSVTIGFAIAAMILWALSGAL